MYIKYADKMKLDKYLALLIFGGLFFLVSCSSNTKTQDLIYSGTKGMEFEVLNSGKEFLATNNLQVPLLIRLSNKGSSTVKNSILTITGYDESIIQTRIDNRVGNNYVINTELIGKTNYNTEGTTIYTPIDLILRDTKQIQDRYDLSLFIHLCYEYSTKLSTTILINPLDLNTEKTKKTFSQGQGAPLAIKEVEYIANQDNVIVTVKVKKESGNLIYYPKTSQRTCNQFEYSESNKFYVDTAILSGERAKECQGKEVLLMNDEAVFSCTFNLRNENKNQETNYVLNLELNYWVYDYKTTQISFVKI